MNRISCPRLSEARQLLPVISGHVVAATSRYPLGAALELWPIVEDGLFGYELVPDRETHTFLIIGRNQAGEPTLRRTLYGVGASDALRLVTVNGRLLSHRERAARFSIQRRDSAFPDWAGAAESACEQLGILFPHRTRESGVVEHGYRYLEEALRVAHSHLAGWDPFIHFCGLPNEAQLGFALMDAGGKQGELTFRVPDTWTLQWNASMEIVTEAWSIQADDHSSATNRAHGDFDFVERRTHGRRATDRGSVATTWPKKDRRQTPGRRTMDR